MAVIYTYEGHQLIMDSNKTYVTQISKKDLEEIADVCNIHAGIGIEITRTDQGLEVSVDRDQLTRWVRKILQGGSI